LPPRPATPQKNRGVHVDLGIPGLPTRRRESGLDLRGQRVRLRQRIVGPLDDGDRAAVPQQLHDLAPGNGRNERHVDDADLPAALARIQSAAAVAVSIIEPMPTIATSASSIRHASRTRTAVP
jgi:hypothetical protein